MRRTVRIVRSLAVVSALAGCGRESRWLHVERIDAGTGAGLVAVNQDLVVHFSDPVDPVTVTPESVRVRDAHGHPVDGEFQIGSRSVRFRPVPPVTPALDDGSFRPGETYRLEVLGMPTSFAVRSRSGAALESGVAREFRVARDAAELGLPTPFLPVDGGDAPLQVELSPLAGLRMAADTGVLQLRFSVPVLPSSVRPAAFHVERIGNGPERDVLVPVTTRVLPGPQPGARYAGTTVELAFDLAARFVPGEPVFLLFSDGQDALLDYRGRPIEALAWPLPVKIDAGSRVRLLDLDLSELTWERDPSTPLGFSARFGRIVAGGFVEAGCGGAGDLVVSDALRLEADGRLVGSDGVVIAVLGPAPELRSLRIEAGAELRLGHPTVSQVLRVVGDVRIDGRLVLADSRRELPWTAGDRPGLESLLRESGVAVVVGGRLIVGARGSVVVSARGPVRGTPLVVVSGSDLEIDGPMTPGCTFALPEGRRIVGVVEAAVRLTAELTPGLPAGCAAEASGSTGWLPLPAHSGAIDVAIFEPRNVTAWIQIAPPHSIVAGQPLVDEQFTTPPLGLPLREAIVVPHGGFFRIGLRGTVRGDLLPSIRGFAIHDR